MDTKIPASELRKRRRKKILIGLTIPLMIIGGVIWTLNSGGRSIKENHLSYCVAETGNVENSVSASGKVVPAYEEVVVSPVASRILELYHHEGELVEGGEPLLRLDLQAARGGVQRLNDELAVRHNSTLEMGLDNKTYLTNLEMQIKVKVLAVEDLRAQVANERRLDSIGSGTGERVRQAELAWRTGMLELEQLHTQLANETGSRAARLESSHLQESIQQRSLDDARRVLGDAGVKSPRKATITYINSNIGGSVAPGEKLAVLSDLGSFKISGEIPEGDAGKITAGGGVNVKIGKKILRGRISGIAPQAANGLISFTVLLEDEADPALRAGIRAELNLITGLKEDVTRIANGPFFHGPGAYRIFVVDKSGDYIESRDVLLGDSNFDFVEVLSGISPGEKVVISDMSEYKATQRINLKR